MQEVFKKITCDRCGTEIYLAQIGEGANNRAVPVFDKPPLGWTVIGEHDACINCTALYKGMIHNFWNE